MQYHSLQGKNLVASWPLHFQIESPVKSILISKKHGKLVASEINLVALATPAATTSNSEYGLEIIFKNSCTVI